MNDAVVALFLILLFLAIPGGIIVLLVISLVKTNRLSRETSAANIEIARLRAEVEWLKRNISPGEVVTSKPSQQTPEEIVVQPAEPPKQAPISPPPFQIPSQQVGQQPLPEQPSVVKPETAAPPFGPPPARPPAPLDSAIWSRYQPPQLSFAAPVQQPAAGQSAPPPPASRPPSRTRAEWEALIGGRLLNWIGALATIIGIGFFLRYAFQNNWINPPMRVAIGIVIGLVSLAGGRYSYNKGYKIFAQGLIGAGISILYLSVFASFSFYQLVPQNVAFLMMSAVTLVTFFQAFVYDSLAVSLLGWAGGFLTPFLLKSGHNNETGLFTYIALLDAGLLAVVARKKKWVVLELLTLGATYLVYAAWYGEFYSPDALPQTLGFLTIFWGLFLIFDLVRIVRPASESPELREISGVFNAVFYYAAVVVVIGPVYHERLALATLLIGAVYFGVILVCRGFKPPAFTSGRYHLTALVLLAIATAIRFSDFWLVFFWSLESLAVIVCASYWNLKAIRTAGLLLISVTLLKLLGTAFWSVGAEGPGYFPFANPRTAAFLMLAVALAASAVAISRKAVRRTGPGVDVLHYAWTLIIGFWLWLETGQEFRRLAEGVAPERAEGLHLDRFLALGVILAAYGLVLLWGGLRTRLIPLVITGLASVVVSVGVLEIKTLAFQPLADFTLVLNLRSAAFVVTIAVAVAASALVGRKISEYSWLKFTAGILLFLGCLLLFSLATAETHDWFRLAIQNNQAAAAALGFREIMSLVVVWSVYFAAIAWIGLKASLPPLQIASLIVMLASIGSLISIGLTYVPIESFTIGINSRALAFVFVISGLALVSRLTQAADGRGLNEFRNIATVVVALVIFFLLTAETKDYFGQQIQIANQMLQGAGAGLDSMPTMAHEHSLVNLQQMALSLVWLVYSIILIAYGIWRRTLSLRILAIILFGITILKIFIYDLSFLETLYRIFSFIGLGLILLTVSYLYQRFKSVIFETGVKAQ